MLFSSLCLCTWSWIKRRCSLMLPCLSIFISDLRLRPEPRTINYSKTLLASLEISVFSPLFAASNQHFSHVWKLMKKKRFQGAESPCSAVGHMSLILSISVTAWPFSALCFYCEISWQRLGWDLCETSFLLGCSAAQQPVISLFFSNSFFFFPS